MAWSGRAVPRAVLHGAAVAAVLWVGAAGTRRAVAVDEMLDPAFGTGGKVTTGLPDNGLAANAVAVDAVGRLVAAGGFAPDGDPAEGLQWVVARHLADGQPDPTFDGDGLRVEATYDCGSVSCDIDGQARAVLPLADGRIVVAGDDGDVVLVARYLAGGQLDPTFGEGGFLRGQYDPDRRTVARGLAGGPAGSVHVLVADVARSTAGDERFAILRLDADGVPDSGFGDLGTHHEAFAPVVARAILRQPDGRIVVAGYHDTGDSPGSTARCFVARYWANGAGRDDTFGDHGIVLWDHGHGDVFDTCTAVALGADGRIAVTGSSNERLGIGRLTVAGAPDTAFSTDGRLTLAPPSAEDSVSGEGVGVDAAGRVIVGGNHWFGDGTSRFLVARIRADGVPDGTFGPGGVVETTFGAAIDIVCYALTVQPDGKPVAAGRAEDTETWSKLALARYRADGLAAPTSSGGSATPTDDATAEATATTPISTTTPTAPAPSATAVPSATPSPTGTDAPTATPSRTATAAPSPTAAPDDYTVRGRVTLERRPASDGARVCLAAACATTDAAGAFTLRATARGEGLALVATHAGYLRAERPVTPPNLGATVDVPPVTLLAGDANEDGRIEVDDAAMIGQRFRLRYDAARPDPLWRAACDFTDDGVIDVLDLVAVQYNLLKTAPRPWP